MDSSDSAPNRAPYRTEHETAASYTPEPMGSPKSLAAFEAVKQVERMQVAQAFIDLLDTYDNGEGECESEDRWRLFRDAYALAERYGATRPAESTVQPPYEPASTHPAA
jgi:hypothetical protein